MYFNNAETYYKLFGDNSRGDKVNYFLSYPYRSNLDYTYAHKLVFFSPTYVIETKSKTSNLNCRVKMNLATD